MIRNGAIGCLAVLALLASVAAGKERVDAALLDLSSPLLEVREEAAQFLCGEGPEVVGKLYDAYRAADYRTKIVILQALASRNPAAGLPLVFEDLDTAERGVANAQKRIVSAIYARPRAAVLRRVVPLVPRAEWKLEEGLRTLPAPIHSARAALAEELRSAPAGRLGVVREVSRLVDQVDEMRRRLAARLARSAGAARLLRHMRIHDIERTFLGVLEVRGLAGTYDGMFEAVRELQLPEGAGRLRVSRVLTQILKDEALGESGDAVATGRPYEFLEPVGLGPAEVRDNAALCLSDLGERSVLDELVEYYDSLPPVRETGLGKNPKEKTAFACADLGSREPLTNLVAEYVNVLEDPALDVYIPRYLLYSRLGMAYSKLGDLEASRERFRRSASIDYTDPLVYYNLACVLTRGGELGEALRALQDSIDLGYGSDWGQVDWMERDGDLAALRDLPAYRRVLRDLKDRLPPR